MIPQIIVKRVIFPLNYAAGGVIQYPDSIDKFSNAVIIDDDIIADYSGVLPLTEYTPQDIGQFFSVIDYLRLFSPIPYKEIEIREAAKTNGFIDLSIKRLELVGGCYTKHPETLQGLDILLQAGLLTETDVDRLKEGLPLIPP